MAQITITLPDGSARELPEGATGTDLARSIGRRLAQAAVIVNVDGVERDLGDPLPAGRGRLLLRLRAARGRDLLRRRPPAHRSPHAGHHRRGPTLRPPGLPCG